MQRKGKKEETVFQRGEGLYFDTAPTASGLPLLLPNETCIAEDEHALFRFRSEREGFHLFGWGDVILYNVNAKVYLTNYRVFRSSSLELIYSSYSSPYHLRSRYIAPSPFALKRFRTRAWEQLIILNHVMSLSSTFVSITEVYMALEIPLAKQLESYLIRGATTITHFTVFIVLAW